MIGLQVVAHGDLEQAFSRFEGQAVKLADRVLRIVAYRYRKYVRTEFLSGQYLGKNTGDLNRSLVAGRAKGKKLVYLVGSKGIKDKATGIVSTGSIKLANIYEHAGGYEIKPKDAKVLVFQTDQGFVFTKKVRGESRPFMTDSTRRFSWDTAFRITEEEVIGKELKRLAKEGVYVPGSLE